MDKQTKVVFWHRELPPPEADAIGEHTLEASSDRVPDAIAHREELWNHCNDTLMVQTNQRLRDEIARLGGRYAHVLSESIDTKHDATTGQAWLHGRFTYMLYA
jgi:hypothetical protein